MLSLYNLYTSSSQFSATIKKLNRLNLALERLVHTVIKMNAASEI